MARDIRSFFSPSAAPKRPQRLQKEVDKEKPSPSQQKPSDEDAAVKASGKREREEEEADGAALKKQKGDAGAELEEEEEEALGSSASAPLVFKYSNLLLTLEKMMHPSWYSVLKAEFSRAYFKNLAAFLKREESKKTIYPPPQDVFAALRDCAFSDLKVVIIGQDPYHGPEQAHGLSFSVRRGVMPPPSLKNIYKEAMADVAIDRPSHGCLSCWSQQGVLLLNTVLTVRRGEPNSHKKQGWEQFTDAIIRIINRDASNVVFLLWGKPAQVCRCSMVVRPCCNALDRIADMFTCVFNRRRVR